FSDPLTGGAKVCSQCRPANAGTASTCNKDSDCCSPDSKCLDIPDSLPAGVKVCTCVPTGGRCDKPANCCSFGNADFPAGRADSASPVVCRTCRHLNEPCPVLGTGIGCCDETVPGTGSTFVRCDLAPDGSGQFCTLHTIN